jgi:hypothetical protein
VTEQAEPDLGESSLSILAGWTLVTGLVTSNDITTFPITLPGVSGTYTGHIKLGAPGYVASGMLRQASYYVTYDDGVNPPENITYAYYYNDLSTSGFYALLFDGTTYSTSNIGTLPIDSIWINEYAPGLTEVKFVSSTTLDEEPIDINLTLTPYANGTVRHTIEFTNQGGSPIEVGYLIEIDTMLNGIDGVEVFSLGTSRGMYIDDVSSSTRVTFPEIPVSEGGPNDYAAARWTTPFTTVFGPAYDVINNMGVSRATSDVLLTGVDSSIFYRWATRTLAPGTSASFSYLVGLTAATEFPTIEVKTHPITVAQGEVFAHPIHWTDADSTSLDLYYSLDGGAPVLFGTHTAMPIPFTLDTQSLAPGNHVIEYYAVDPTGNISNYVSIPFAVTAPVVPVVPTILPTTGDTFPGVLLGSAALICAAAVLLMRRRLMRL